MTDEYDLERMILAEWVAKIPRSHKVNAALEVLRELERIHREAELVPRPWLPALLEELDAALRVGDPPAWLCTPGEDEGEDR